MAVDGWVFADRIDWPFVLEAGGNAAPYVSPPLPSFPDARWGAQWRAQLVLAEFLKQVVWTTFNLKVSHNGDPGDPLHDPAGEIATLLQLAEDNRADALGEILSQNGEFLSCFAGLLHIAPGSRPATRTLLHIAELVATVAVMHFKYQEKRARPSAICPALFPPVSVPSHPSWPSGHATQSHLVFLILDFALAGSFTISANNHGPVPGNHGPLIQALRVLADRIARNREIAGLHFPTDSAAGKNLADELLDVLKTCPTFLDIVAAAKQEAW